MNDHEKQEIVISTTNKKYYKRFHIPELLRGDISNPKSTPEKLQDKRLQWSLENNTLIISVSIVARFL